jgi:general secretion pathway protein J
VNSTLNRSRAFTLLEILVAISIFAVISAICYATLNRVMGDSHMLDAERTKWTRLAIAWSMIEDDFSFARNRGIRDAIGERLPAFIGQPTDPRAVAPPTVEFTRGGLWALSTSDKPVLARIDYRLKDHQLIRETWPSLDRAPDAKPSAQLLLDGVTRFEVRFMNAGSQWVDHWPETGASAKLPRAVEVTLQTPDVGSITRVLEVAR